MDHFTNEFVKKEYKKQKNILYVGLFLIVLAFVFLAWGIFKGEEEVESISMHTLIMNDSTNNEYGYIDSVMEPYVFAYYEGEESEFYFISDENYFYVARMTPSTYEEIKNATEENPIRISGIAKSTPSDIKRIAIETYNELVDEEYQLANTDFDNYFGPIYLDLEDTPMGVTDWIMIIVFILGIIGLIVVLIGIINTFKYKRNVKKITMEEIEKIDKELNDKDAFYYKKAHLYLTKNYIVNFGGTFEAIPYKSIIWIYKFEYRQNGIKTQQSIIVVTKDGKKHNVAVLDGLTKKAKEVFEEILYTIIQNSPESLVGFTPENKKLMKTRIEK